MKTFLVVLFTILLVLITSLAHSAQFCDWGFVVCTQEEIEYKKAVLENKLRELDQIESDNRHKTQIDIHYLLNEEYKHKQIIQQKRLKLQKELQQLQNQ